MTKYRVYVQQWVEEVATIVIEASNVEEAIDKAEEMLRDGDVDDWMDGTDIKDREAYAASEEGGEEMLWERL